MTEAGDDLDMPLSRGNRFQAQGGSNSPIDMYGGDWYVVDWALPESEILLMRILNVAGDQEPTIAALLNESETGPELASSQVSPGRALSRRPRVSCVCRNQPSAIQ